MEVGDARSRRTCKLLGGIRHWRQSASPPQVPHLQNVGSFRWVDGEHWKSASLADFHRFSGYCKKRLRSLVLTETLLSLKGGFDQPRQAHSFRTGDQLRVAELSMLPFQCVETVGPMELDEPILLGRVCHAVRLCRGRSVP